MPTNADQFDLDIAEFDRGWAVDQIVTIQRKLALQAIERVVQKTPVDSGLARGNWHTTLGVKSAAVTSNADKSGARAIAAGGAVAARFTDLGRLWVTNNLPYIEVLELGGFTPKNPGPSKDPRKGRKGRVLVQGGYSVQAPNGMVAVTFAELRSQFE